VRGPKQGERQESGAGEALHLYCLAAAVANEASQGGFPDFARALENALCGFLSGLPREEQAEALRLSYEIALGGAEPAPPRLRLIYSRE
jgi:hypothetical protein